ncbi:MAG: hypothetical protein WAW36_06130 [Methylovulum miyakonense]|uniref:hypothetical protein n=1 Tax=Methylovulum miyakonense TaxID=645578 RepID=UPI003BB5045C
MSILKKIQEAIEASRTVADLTISEDPGCLSISGSMSNTVLASWQKVLDHKCLWLELNFIDDSDDPIEPKDGKQGEWFRLTLTFASSTTTPHIFTSEGWRSLLLNEEVLSAAKIIRLGFIENEFKTKAFNIEPWLDDSLTVDVQEAKNISEVSPRRQVRCQSPDLLAPIRIEPWVLVGSLPVNCPATKIWQEVSVEMIAKSLTNELYKDGNVAKVVLSGQPTRKLEFGIFQPNNIPFKILQEAAAWVYLEGEDVEVRHTFLSSELSRAWSPNVSFCEGIPKRLASALDSARLLYKAHLRSGSKDIIKALADLRKTLADEVQKLLQQSKDLSSAVWRDVAIAIGVIGVRFAMEGAKANQVTDNFTVIYFMVALYIFVSYTITVTTNKRFLKIVEDSRQSWRTKLYAFLDDNDYQALAETPLSDAVSAYKNTQKQTTRVVFVVVIALMAIAASEQQWIGVGQLIDLIKNAFNH